MKKIDNLGRIVIPKNIRKKLNIKENDELDFSVRGKSIIITKVNEPNYEERINKALYKIENPPYTGYELWKILKGENEDEDD